MTSGDDRRASDIDQTVATHPLDDPVRSSLLGAHAHLALRRGRVLRYPAEVSPFVGLPAEPTDEDWADLAELSGPGTRVPLAGIDAPVPPTWTSLGGFDGMQLVAGEELAGERIAEDGGSAVDPEVVRLTTADVADMLALVARTDPGPFGARTIELGSYLGIRRDGELIAMAGERMHPPGWTEISAVCTDPAHRGQGLAARLIAAVAQGIRERGEVPFLHVLADNTSALRLYERLGFRPRRVLGFRIIRTPG